MLFVDPALEQQGFPVFVRPSHRDHPDYNDDRDLQTIVA